MQHQQQDEQQQQQQRTSLSFASASPSLSPYNFQAETTKTAVTGTSPTPTESSEASNLRLLPPVPPPLGQMPTSSDSDALFAQELNKLTLKERNEVLYDVHGVSDVIEETPDMVDAAVGDMARCLDQIPAADKIAYDMALQQNPAYVTDRKFWLMFLRAVRFRPNDAAQRLVAFFQMKYELFPQAALARDVRLSDLDEDDMRTLTSGYVQVCDSRDRAGRAIFTIMPMIRKNKTGENKMTFGIPGDTLPITPGGMQKSEAHLEYIQMMRRAEELPSEDLNKRIILPGKYDVLLGRGKPLQKHPGNLNYHCVVESYHEEYEQALKLEKTKLAAKIVDQIRRQGGRFLKQDHVGWIEIDEEASRTKISHTFRNHRIAVRTVLKKQQRQQKQAQQQQAQQQQQQAQQQQASVVTVSAGIRGMFGTNLGGRLSPGMVLDPTVDSKRRRMNDMTDYFLASI